MSWTIPQISPNGVTKLAQSKEKRVASGTGAALAGFSPGVIKVIDVLEVLAAVELVVPAALDIAPVAAVGVVLLIVGALVTHVRRQEAFVAPLVPFALAVALVWGRFDPQSFTG
jgi:hypothetical protein